MKKKVCVFCSLSSFNTGMPISTYKLAAGLRAGGEVDVCAALPEEGELAERLRAAAVDVAVIPFCRFKTDFASMARFLASWFRAGLGLYRLVRKRGIDIVHFSDIIDAPFYPWARLGGARAVAHVRVCIGGPVVRRLYRMWTHLFCTRIITVSEFAKSYFGFGRRASVVYNPGPDRAIFNIAKRQHKSICVDDTPTVTATPTTPVGAAICRPLLTIIAVASFRKEKGHHNFIRIAAKIKSRLPEGQVKFIITGGKVPGHEKYYDEVTADIRRLGLDGCLTVTGNIPHEQVAPIMANADVLLHAPDWEEALGGVVLEAMAMGAAVIAYNRGGVGECFVDGKSGFLVRYGGIDEVVDKAVMLLDDPELRDEMTLRARRELDDKFTIDRYVNGVKNVYDDIASSATFASRKKQHPQGRPVAARGVRDEI